MPRKISKTDQKNNFQKPLDRSRVIISQLLGREDIIGDVITVEKEESGWKMEFEIIDRDEYMEEIGSPIPVYERTVYSISLDNQLNLVSYGRKDRRPYLYTE